MPLFSVVIPTFNRVELLKRTLESVWAQTFTDYEVIVVDDGSTDGTLEFLKSLAGRVTLLTQSNRGPGPARNLGAEKARGQYVAFLDSDDLWFPWTLETFAQLICQHRSPAILSASLVEFSDEVTLAALKLPPVRAEYFPDYFATSHLHYFVGAGMAVLRRTEFLKTGGFTEKRINAEDHDLILRMGTAPGFVQILEPFTLAWRRHAGSATKNFRLSFEGNRYLVEQEERGAYPGGRARRRERIRIVSSHVRPISVECLRQKLRAEAWTLYRATVGWHVRLGRWKYLVGFPAMALLRQG